LVDWIAAYWQRIEEFPVLSQVRPGEIRAELPPSAPRAPESFEAVLSDFERILLPGITHWQSPSFFAFFPTGASGPSVLADLLSSGLGVQGMLWATSPAATELETHVLDWIVDMLALPAGFRSDTRGGGVIQDSASSASLCALLAARERATELASSRTGVPAGLVAYATREAHSSIEKNMAVAGIGRDNLRLVAVDARFAMDPAALAAAIDADKAAGLRPFFVSATVGTTSSNAIDPLPAIGAVCREKGLWLHVDAAMSGTAALCEELRHIHEGLELADSYVFNPHKWMLVNFDCSCFYVKERAALIDALSIMPEYLKNAASRDGAVIDYRDWQIPLGRRFRALKLWFVIRSYGVEGLKAVVRRHVGLAQEFAGWVKASAEFELAAPVPLNLVCFRHKGGDRINEAIRDRLNASGRLYLTHTRLSDRTALRLSIGQAATEREHVAAAWAQIQAAARGASEGSGKSG
jgi:aromatic-L-amino-acid decarboxylase